MKDDKNRAIIGLIVAGIGVLLLMQSVGFLVSAWSLVWAVIFTGGGVALIMSYRKNRANWWLLIPGTALVAIGVTTGLETISGGLFSNVAGAVVLGGIAAGFIWIYYKHRENWWAVIPGGVMATLATMVLIFGDNGGPEAGSFFLMGLAATFGVVYALPVAPKSQVTWAIFPAIGLLALAVVSFAATASAGGFIVPLAMIGVGVFLVYRWLHPATA